jgi:cation diffusion facilitator family transporter
MHTQDPSAWTHEHRFDAGNEAGERGARAVMWITAAMMVVEIAAGWMFNSMALLADGWHMSSHAMAIGLSAFAYAAARRHVGDSRYAFGTWKIEVLGGFTSAVVLLGVAALMVFGSIERIITPQPIQYQQAIAVAVLGFVVNVLCAVILGNAHHSDSGGHHSHDGHAHHEDLNLKSAYLHVLADATTSVLAIVALAGGWFWGWSWLDPTMGIVGATLIAVWARGLITETGKVLLDREMDHPVVEEIREAIAENAGIGETRITDLHVWRVGKRAYACALCVVTHDETLTPNQVRGWLAEHQEIAHATVEINRCG